MNIFVLSESPVDSARWLHDRHVVKMIVESCQLLSTAIQTWPDWTIEYESIQIPWGIQPLYKPTHTNHPCIKWTGESPHNFVWLTIHLSELLSEYHRRFPGRTHKCESLAHQFYLLAARFAGVGFYTSDNERKRQYSFGILAYAAKHTEFVYCGPESYARGEAKTAIDSYREYYINDKVGGNRWSHHKDLQLPLWLNMAAVLHFRPSVPTRKRLFTPTYPDVPPSMKMPTRFGVKKS